MRPSLAPIAARLSIRTIAFSRSGQRAFGVGGELLDQQVRSRQPEDPVSQKLQALIVARIAPPGAADSAGQARVGDRFLEQRLVREAMAEHRFELAQARARALPGHAAASG